MHLVLFKKWWVPIAQEQFCIARAILGGAVGTTIPMKQVMHADGKITKNIRQKERKKER